MTISTRVTEYLKAKNIRFDTVNHGYANSSVSAAIEAHLAPKNVAKAVVLEDDEGRHLMAIVPAHHKIRLHELRNQMHVMDLHLVDEAQVYKLFNDCDPGAVPALGPAYNMKSVYDDALSTQSDIYFEAGDHKTLIHLTNDQFRKLMSDSQHGRFSEQIFH